MVAPFYPSATGALPATDARGRLVGEVAFTPGGNHNPYGVLYADARKEAKAQRRASERAAAAAAIAAPASSSAPASCVDSTAPGSSTSGSSARARRRNKRQQRRDARGAGEHVAVGGGRRWSPSLLGMVAFLLLGIALVLSS